MFCKYRLFGSFLSGFLLLGTTWAMADTVDSKPTYMLKDKVITAKADDVIAEQNLDFSLLGQKNVLDVPFSANVVTAKQLSLYASPTGPVDKVLINNPAIRSAGSNLHNDFTYRGLRANGTSSLVNGIPGLLTQFNLPLYAMERVIMLDGPASGLTGVATQYESTASGGIVNFQTKRAGDKPITAITFTHSGKGSFGTYLDVARRFGSNQEWGIRVNAEHLDGETAISKENIKAKSLYVNLDHHDEKSKTNLWVGYRDNEVKNGMRWFKLGANVKELPQVPISDRNYSFDGMVKSSYGYVAALNHEQKLNERWTAFFNGGMNHNNLDQNIMATNSAYTLKNSNGDFNLGYQIGGTPQNTYYAQLGFTGKYNWLNASHRITLALDKSWKKRESAYGIVYALNSNVKYGILGVGNLYTGLIQTDMPITKYQTGPIARETMKGLSLLDTITYKKWQGVVGVHWHQAKTSSYNTQTGSAKQTIVSSALSPTVALMYKPNEHLSFYGNHSEYFDSGRVVGNTRANAGTILNPAKAKQNEIGAKYEKENFMASLSIFDITQATNIDVQKEEAGILKIYTLQDGNDRYKGAQLSFAGQFGRKWSVFGGAMYLNARQEHTAKGLNDGRRVSAQPSYSGVLGAIYSPNDALSFTGRMTYFGSSIIRNAASQNITVPSYTVFDIGASYKTHLGTIPTTFEFMLYNAFNRNYWMASRGDQVYISAPRTIMFSTKFEF